MTLPNAERPEGRIFQEWKARTLAATTGARKNQPRGGCACPSGKATLNEFEWVPYLIFTHRPDDEGGLGLSILP
jgi:hypothetical protein